MNSTSFLRLVMAMVLWSKWSTRHSSSYLFFRKITYKNWRYQKKTIIKNTLLTTLRDKEQNIIYRKVKSASWRYWKCVLRSGDSVATCKVSVLICVKAILIIYIQVMFSKLNLSLSCTCWKWHSKCLVTFG